MAENKAQNTQKNTQKKDADRKKDARNRKRMGNQREIWLSAGSIGVLFLCLLVYLGHFVATSEQDMINNSYNSRQQILLSRNYRGSIYSRDGDVLAETILDADESNRVFQLHRLSRHFRANGDPCGYLDFRGFRLCITTFRGGTKSLSEFFSIGVCDIACTRIVAQQCVYNSDVQA